MAPVLTTLPRLTQAVDRGHLVATVMKLYGYDVIVQPTEVRNSNSKSLTCLSVDKELFYVSSPVFKIEDETRVWKLKLEEYQTKELTAVEKDSVSLGDIRIQIGKTRKLNVTGDVDGSQLRQSCQRGIIEDIECILKNSRCCNVLLNLCDVPYPRPEDLCDKVFSSSLLQLHSLKKLLVIHPKSDAEICGLVSGVDGTWNRYLATDMACLLWKKDESYFRKFEKKYLKQVVRNGLHDVKKKGEKSVRKSQYLETKSIANLVVERQQGRLPRKKTEKPVKKSQREEAKPMGDLVVERSQGGLPLVEIWSHPVLRGFCLTLTLLAFYFLSSETLVTLLLIAASIWFKYCSKKPEFKKYTRSSDPKVLTFRNVYEKEIEKLRYAKDLKRMRNVHRELKESVLNCYAVNRVSTGDIIGVEDHEELERELELTFKEFVTENDVKTLVHEAHYMSFFLVFTVFLYVMSRFIYLVLGKLWRPVRTVAIIVSAILLCLDLWIVSDFLSTSVFSAPLLGSVQIFSLVFGLWLVTDVTGVLIEIRACIDHVTGVIWREVELEKCILKSPNYIVVKVALDCSVLLSLFPMVYATSGILSIFSVSSATLMTVSRYFPPGVLLLSLCKRLAFLGIVLSLANVIMCASLAWKFYGIHKKKEDWLDARLYDLLGHNIGSMTEYLWKPVVEYLNDINYG